ncbi:MAG TPA: LemA family protein [Clostridiales bacterium]|nr:LemA family protein [Clostridiales bacterium]
MKKKNTGLIVLGVVIAVVVIIVGIFVSNYNSLVDLETDVEKYAGNINAELQRRSDLIPNLVNTVKGYAAHEEKIYTDIANARSRLAGASTMQEKAEANDELSSALSRLLVVVENYPDLKANQNFIGLQDQLEGTENRIKVARTDYNDAVKKYNNKIRRFPSNIVAGMFGFEKAEYFEASESAKEVPQVSFD